MVKACQGMAWSLLKKTSLFNVETKYHPIFTSHIIKCRKLMEGWYETGGSSIPLPGTTAFGGGLSAPRGACGHGHGWMVNAMVHVVSHG